VKPNKQLVLRAAAIPELQRAIEVGSGLRKIEEITGALSDILRENPISFQRSWFRYRQPQPDGVIPSLDMLLNLVEAARALKWLPRSTFAAADQRFGVLEEKVEPGELDVDGLGTALVAPDIQSLPGEVVELLEFLDIELDKRRRAIIEPAIKQFAKDVFTQLSALDLDARIATTAARKAGRGSGARKVANKAAKASAVEGVQPTSTFAVSMPLVMRSVSQAFVALILRDFPDWQSRPVGFDIAGLEYLDVAADRKLTHL